MYSQLYPEMVTWLPGCPTSNPPLMLQALRRVGREFCEKTEAFHEVFVPQRATAFQQDYTVVHPYDTEAEVHRILNVKINGNPYPDDTWEVYQERIMRLDPSFLPTSLDNRMLICGTAGSPTTIATWKAVTAGSVTLSVYGSTYALTALSFASCSDMDDVARVVQNAINTSMSSQRAFFRWNPATNSFHLWVKASTVSYMTAGTTGTDISGPTWLNGLAGATATLGGYVEIEAVLRPHFFTETLPAWFYDRWSSGIMAGAIAHLAQMDRMPWASPNTADKFHREYRNAIGTAKMEERDRMQSAVRGFGA